MIMAMIEPLDLIYFDCVFGKIKFISLEGK